MNRKPDLRRRKMKKNILSAVMRRVVLSAVVMVSGLALLSGCATLKGETTGEYIDDSTITTKANSIVVKDPDAHLLKIDVTTTKGDVVLQGYVNSRDTEGRIVGKIKEIRGVKSVKSLLSTRQGETAGEFIDDSTTTAQVNGIIVKDPDAHYLKIDVTTAQGEVVLQGFVNSRDTEARLVEEIKKIKGVKSVKSLLKLEEKK
jgi:hyperosmotically inducible periplasmic protein